MNSPPPIPPESSSLPTPNPAPGASAAPPQAAAAGPGPVPGAGLTTPVYFKLESSDAWPQDRVFYYLTADGLFLCRNHAFYTSSVPVKAGPCELAAHKPMLRARYPLMSRRLVELAVGFFHAVYLQHRSEAGLLLLWHPRRKTMRLICPRQVATVSRSWGGTYPIGLHYEIPDLGEELLMGDLHSHGDESAYASGVDKYDEMDRGAGVHLVVGRLDRIDRHMEPEFHIDALADGMRFTLDPAHFLAGYQRPRNDFPSQWLQMVKVESYTYSHNNNRQDDRYYSDGYSTPSYPRSYTSDDRGPADSGSGGASAPHRPSGGVTPSKPHSGGVGALPPLPPLPPLPQLPPANQSRPDGEAT